jgi:hypothetical protein
MTIMKFVLLAMGISLAACSTDPAAKAKDSSDEFAPATPNPSYQGTTLPAQLKEISGMTRDRDHIWAISDAPTPVLYKLNKEGRIIQETAFKSIKVTDMESLTSDNEYVYIADVGNNKGNRSSRSVIRIPKAILSQGSSATTGEVISFSFAGAEQENCEAMLAWKDSLYFFTKQNDGHTQLFSIPKQPGKWTARKLGEIEAGGLITGASINHSGSEVALSGYRSGHSYPFVLLISDFKDNNFLSGQVERYELDSEHRDWQVESVSYLSDDELSFACEGTKDVPQTLYTISRNDLVKLPQQTEGSGQGEDKKGKKKKGKKKANT